MIRHIILFKFREDAGAETIEAIRTGLAGLEQKVGGLSNFAWGSGITDDGRQHGYTHGFTMDFADEAALRAYGPHPAHQAVVAMIRPNLVADDAAVLAFDYEMRASRPTG